MTFASKHLVRTNLSAYSVTPAAMIYAAFLILILCSTALFAQNTLGVLHYNKQAAQDGYTLFAPIGSTTTYLIDNCGNLVHSWPSAYTPGLSVHLLEDGSILRAGQTDNQKFSALGGHGGIIERIAWDGTVVWSYTISSDTAIQHHMLYPMPGGNVMVIAAEYHTKAEAQGLGRKMMQASEIWSERIIELKPQGTNGAEVLWQWRAWDHLVQNFDSSVSNFAVVGDHPELINLNFGALPAGLPDWLHINAVDYNVERNELLLSCHNFNEIWIIDHSTTTAEAASHAGGRSKKGGDLLYRWGNPQTYQQGAAADKKLGLQHGAHWIAKGLVDAGKVMLFNNNARTRTDTITFSAIDILDLPVDGDGHYFLENKRYGPTAPSWRYVANPPNSFFANFLSNAQRLPNGNTLICNGANGNFFEMSPLQEEVWRYVNPVSAKGVLSQGDTAADNKVFHVQRLPITHPAFVGRALNPITPIEKNPSAPCSTSPVLAEDANVSLVKLEMQDFPSHKGSLYSLQLPEPQQVTLQVVDMQGRIIVSLHQGTMLQASMQGELPELGASGVYVLFLQTSAGSIARPFVYLHSN